VFWRTERCFSSSAHFDHSGVFLIVLVVVVVLLILPVKEAIEQDDDNERTEP
jgi:hypothetical protein